MLESEAVSINWWLEIAKIAIPVVTTIFVGWIIARRNERFKNNLTREVQQYQTRDSVLHQKQAEAVETIYGLLLLLEADCRHLEWTAEFIINNDDNNGAAAMHRKGFYGQTASFRNSRKH